MFKPLQQRLGFGCVFILSVTVLAGSYLLEYNFDLEPCALCLLQRYVLGMIAFLAGIAFLQNPYRIGTRLYVCGLILLNSVGILLAGRHLWVQYANLPDTIVPCTAGLQTMLQFKPLLSVLAEVLQNAHACQQIHKLLGLPLSVWSMTIFISLIVLLGWTWKRSQRNTAAG